MSESLSHAFFLMSVAVLVSALPGASVRRFAIAGALLGVATLFRAYFEYVATFTLLPAALVLAAALAVSLHRLGRGTRALPAELRRPQTRLGAIAACWIAAFLAFTAVTIPWRTYKLARWKTASLVSAPPGYTFTWAWVPDERQPSFFKAANAACKTDPQLCAVVQDVNDRLTAKQRQKLALMTFAFRPGRWISFKLSHFDWLWLGQELSSALRHPVELLDGAVLLVLGFGSASWLAIRCARRRRVELYQLAWLAGGFAAWNAVLFTFLQYEWRYSLAARMFSFMLPLLCLALERRLEER